jgi:hypothetical protein
MNSALKTGRNLLTYSEGLPARGVVFWPVGTGDSTTVVASDTVVLQVDLHDLAKAQDEEHPEVAVVDRLVEALPLVDGIPYLAVFALTHADKDHCLGFADLLERVQIGELWSTPRLWREYYDPEAPDLCPDAIAFREESERRIEATMKAVTSGSAPKSGDRICVVGYDTDHDKHAYSELPDQYLTGPGHSISVLDGHDLTGTFEAFIHAPFREDAAAARNETSLSMQVTLTDESGIDGKVLLFGDLAHDTIMKIFKYSEDHGREEYLEWDLLLAPHHCSKKVMYKKDENGSEVLQLDVLDAFEKHARFNAAVVSSSGVFPNVDEDGMNPPHKMAADRYREIAEEVICTMSWIDEGRPSPVVFGVDSAGVGIIRGELLRKAATEAARELAATATGRRFAAITAAAVSLAEALPGQSIAGATGPERIENAVAKDRGGKHAPENPVGFGS